MDFFNSIGLNMAIAIAFVSILIYLYFTSKFNYWKKRGVPYVEPVPFVGNLKDQLLNSKSSVEVYENIYQQLRGNRCGGFFEVRIPALMILDPELVDRILIKDFEHFYDRGFPADPERDPLSANLFHLEGQCWRNLRNKITPTFTTGKLKSMFEQISICGDSLIKYINEQSKIQDGVESSQLMSNFALDVIASCAFGIRMDTTTDINKKFSKAIGEIYHPSRVALLTRLLYIYSPEVAKRLGIRTISKSVEKSVMEIIKDTIRLRNDNNVDRNDFFQLLLTLKKKECNSEFDRLNNQDSILQNNCSDNDEEEADGANLKADFTESLIAAQSFVFLRGGSETVSTTIGYCLYCLTQNPQIQDRVFREIVSVLENSRGEWSYQVIQKMTYLDQVIQETLRLYPTIPILFRVCTKPYNLPGTNTVIEAGTRVLIPVYSIQNDPKNYDCPHVFDPERFEYNNFKPNGKYLSFGNGPRMCIAMRFAVLELKVALARILYNFSINLNAKTKTPVEFKSNTVLLFPKHGLYFDFIKRLKI